MDLTGRTVIEPRFSFGREFLEGLAPVMAGKKWRFVNSKGERAFPREFANAERYSEGITLQIGLWRILQGAGA
jgi:WG repeat protein